MPKKLYFEKWLLQINSISHGSYFAFLMPIMGVPNYMICIINQNSSCVAAAVQQLNNKAFLSKLYKYIFTQMMQFRALLFTFFWSVSHADIFNCQCFLNASEWLWCLRNGSARHRLGVIILLLSWHFSSWVGAFSFSAFVLWEMLGYCVVPCSAVMVLPFPTVLVALREGLGTCWLLGPLLSQALLCRWAGPCMIRNPGCSVQPYGRNIFGGFVLLVLPCFSWLLLSEASGERVEWSPSCNPTITNVTDRSKS